MRADSFFAEKKDTIISDDALSLKIGSTAQCFVIKIKPGVAPAEVEKNGIILRGKRQCFTQAQELVIKSNHLA